LASGRPGRAGLIRDLFAASNVTLAMFAVTNADLLAARYLLEPEQAGRYAVLSILTKGAIWAPQVVTVLALPRLARRVRHTTALATAAVAACGVLLVSAAAVAGPLAVRLVGGPRYVDLAGYAPAFAAAGALYALVFLLVNANLAGGGRAPAAPLWMGLAGFTAVVLSLPAPRIGSVVGVALGTAAVTTLAVISAARWVSQREHRT
jgi:O-antigen/teichoic acid export membrane protein